jgi:predicted GNAT family acetyltransferase
MAEVRDNPARSRFEILVDGEVAGFVSYLDRGEEWTLVHTEVDPAYEHRGLAGELIRTTLDAMRDRGASVLPQCRFVRAFITEHPEYLALVPADRRTDYGLPSD